jgi:MFS family permease
MPDDRIGIDDRKSTAAAGGDTQASQTSMVRLAIASCIGTTIELADFGLFALAAVLVFPHIFFPALGEAAGMTASLATFGVAFVARPLGSIIFGHIGDRLGRKGTLITTLTVMGVSTALVGAIPPASQIGVAAPIILVALRFMQGLAVGGEWAGAVLTTAEHAPTGSRAFWAMFASLGGGFGAMLSSALVLAGGLGMREDAYLSWGWRIPFLASIVLVALGLWARLNIDETPVFKAEVERNGPAHAPFLEAVRSQPREVILGAGTMVMVYASYYFGITFMTNYARTELDVDRTTTLTIGLLATGTYTVGICLSGILADRQGRRATMIAAAAAAVAFPFIAFQILNMGSVLSLAIAMCGTMFITGAATGPLGALLSELFHTRYRYSAAGFCYNFAGIIGGAVPPLFAASITTQFGAPAYGVLVSMLSLVSLLCVLGLRESRGTDLRQVDSTG